ncbi:hypothetical protein GCM10022275_14270 [Tessaracoccus defluvii]
MIGQHTATHPVAPGCEASSVEPRYQQKIWGLAPFHLERPRVLQIKVRTSPYEIGDVTGGAVE